MKVAVSIYCFAVLVIVGTHLVVDKPVKNEAKNIKNTTIKVVGIQVHNACYKGLTIIRIDNGTWLYERDTSDHLVPCE